MLSLQGLCVNLIYHIYYSIICEKTMFVEYEGKWGRKFSWFVPARDYAKRMVAEGKTPITIAEDEEGKRVWIVIEK